MDVGEEPAPRPTTTVEMKKFVAEEATPPAVPLHNNINGLPQRLVNGAGTSVDDDDYTSTSSSDEACFASSSSPSLYLSRLSSFWLDTLHAVTVCSRAVDTLTPASNKEHHPGNTLTKKLAPPNG